MEIAEKTSADGQNADGQNDVYGSIPEAVLVFLIPGFLQGLALWALVEWQWENMETPASWLVALLMALLVTPVAHYLTTTRNTRLPAAIYSVILGTFIAGLYLLAEASFGAKPGIDEHLIGLCFFSSFLIAWISAPFFRTVIERRRKATDYPSLFEFAWNLPVVGIAAGVFVIALWIVLSVWAALFGLIGITFFNDLFYEPWFMSAATFAGGAIAIGIVREREGIVLALRSILFALLRVLSPILSIATALFAVAALVQGMDVLWDNWSATSTMVCAIAIAVTLSNAVVGETGMPGNAILRWSVRLQSLVLPVLAVFAVYGLWIRMHEYGLTVARIHAAIIVIFAAAYSLAYFASAVMPRGWGFLRQANIALAGVIFIMAVLVQTPLLNTWSWTVNDQIARLEDGRLKPAEFDFAYFQFDLGRAGQEGLDRIIADETLPEHDYLVDQIRTVRAAENRYQYATDDNITLGRVETAIEDGEIEIVPVGLELPSSLLAKLSADDWLMEDCIRGRYARCIMVQSDVLGGEEPQYLLFRQGNDVPLGQRVRVISINLFIQTNGTWTNRTLPAAEFFSQADADAFMEAVAAGDVRGGTVTVRTLEVGGKRIMFQRIDESLEDRLIVDYETVPPEEDE